MHNANSKIQFTLRNLFGIILVAGVYLAAWRFLDAPGRYLFAIFVFLSIGTIATLWWMDRRQI